MASADAHLVFVSRRRHKRNGQLDHVGLGTPANPSCDVQDDVEPRRLPLATRWYLLRLRGHIKRLSSRALLAACRSTFRAQAFELKVLKLFDVPAGAQFLRHKRLEVALEDGLVELVPRLGIFD